MPTEEQIRDLLEKYRALADELGDVKIPVSYRKIAALDATPTGVWISRKDFLKLPLEIRRRYLKEQAEQFNKENPDYYEHE